MFLPRSTAVERDQLQVVKVVRDDGVEDALTRRCYATYGEAYDELDRFYGDLCCSDDRIEYSITLAAETQSQESTVQLSRPGSELLVTPSDDE